MFKLKYALATVATIASSQAGAQEAEKIDPDPASYNEAIKDSVPYFCNGGNSYTSETTREDSCLNMVYGATIDFVTLYQEWRESSEADNKTAICHSYLSTTFFSVTDFIFATTDCHKEIAVDADQIAGGLPQSLNNSYSILASLPQCANGNIEFCDTLNSIPEISGP